jgi:hypothetical protein
MNYPDLRYFPSLRRTRVRSQYRKWRHEQGLGERCDNEACRFFSEPLVWNGKPLPLILDHREGNKFDNRPEMLRLLCPNCDAQLPTRGGANRGRLRWLHLQGFTIRGRDGTSAYTYFPVGGPQLGGTGETKFVSATTKRQPKRRRA